MPIFKTSGYTLSPKEQIINNVFESLFFIKVLGHFRPFWGVTELTPFSEIRQKTDNFSIDLDPIVKIANF